MTRSDLLEVDELQRQRQLQAAAKGTIQSSLGKAVGGVAAFLLIGLVTRSLGPAKAGFYFEAVALVTILSTMGTLGAEVGVIREMASAVRRSAKNAIHPTLLVGIGPPFLIALGITTAVEILVPNIAAGIGMEGLGTQGLWSLRMMLLCIPVLVGEQILVGATRGLGSTAGTAVVDSAGLPAIRLVLSLIAILTGARLWTLALAWTVPAVLSFLAAAGWVWTLLRSGGYGTTSWWARTEPRWSLMSRFWRFTYARGIASIFQVAMVWLGILLVGFWSTTSQAAMYGVISRVALVGVTFLQALNLALSPLIASSLAVHNAEEAQHLYQTATGWIVTLGIPVYAVVAVFSAPILRLFGSTMGSASVGLTVVAIAMIWNILTGPVTDVLLMGGKSRWNMFNAGTALSVNVLFGVLLIPRYGANGAAIAWALAIAVDNALPVTQVWLAMKMRPFSWVSLATAAVAIALFAGSGALATLVLGDSLQALGIAVLPAGAIYAGWLWRKREVLRLHMLGEVMPRAQRRSARQVEGCKTVPQNVRAELSALEVAAKDVTTTEG